VPSTSLATPVCSANFFNPNPVGWLTLPGQAGGAVAKAVTGAVTQVATVTIGEVLRGLSDWVAQGTTNLLTSMAQVIAVHTQPELGATWFVDHYKLMTGIAMLLVLPLILAAAISAIVRQDAGALLRAIGIQLPLAALGTFLAIQLVSMALAVTDALCNQVSPDTHADTLNFLTLVGQRLNAMTATTGQGAFAVLLVAILMAVGVLLVSLELVMRDASVYVAVLFLPLALAGLVWPATIRWGRRLVELLVVLILSKFIIVAIISLGAAALSTGFAQDQYSGVIAGAALMLLAAFAPYVLLRLVPIVEAGTIGHMEGVSRRANPARVANDARSMVQSLLPGGLVGGGEPSDQPAAGSAAGDAMAKGAVAGAEKSSGVGEFEGDDEDWTHFGGRSTSVSRPGGSHDVAANSASVGRGVEVGTDSADAAGGGIALLKRTVGDGRAGRSGAAGVGSAGGGSAGGGSAGGGSATAWLGPAVAAIGEVSAGKDRAIDDANLAPDLLEGKKDSGGH
jgi:hypothetical protein